MRTIRALLRWLSAGILALALLLAIMAPVSGDTGAYRIADYTVTLEPQNDGTVKITYNQTWEVTDGNIPWITVGLPNSHFSVLDFSGAADSVKVENSGGFSGLRIDLDQRYLAGDRFSLQFSILQSNLLERLTADREWRISFTPGWYDRAEIDRLEIKLISPVDPETYSSISPEPSSSAGRVITWQRQSLSSGERFKITVRSTDGSFLSALPEKNDSLPGSSSTESATPHSGGFFTPTFFVIIAVIVAIGLFISLALWKYKKNQEAALQKRIADYEKEMAADKAKKAEIESGFKEYLEQKNIEPDSEGRYYDRSYGNYITPAIWAAYIFYQQQQRLNAANYGAHVPPNHPHTPSCACVSCACACACACAGGGAAGCAKKSIHECPVCRPPEEDTGPAAIPPLKR